MTTVAVAETAESTALHGFWTRSRKAGVALAVAGLAIALGLGFGALDAGDTAAFRLNLTLDVQWDAPVQVLVIVLGAICAICGLTLITGKEQRHFGLLVGLGVAAMTLALLSWAVNEAHTPLQVESILSLSVVASLPLIYGSLAGVLCERSGVINVGIEGQLLAGAFTGALVGSLTGSPWAGMFAAALSGALVTFLLAALAIRYLVDQVVLGVILNLLVLGLTGILYDKLMSEEAQVYNQPPGAPEWQVPFLSDVPIVGPAIFRQNIFVYVAIVLVAGIYFLLFHSRWGLRTRAVGEHPAAADTVGIKVNVLRFRNVIIAGLVSGFGGALFTIGAELGFGKNMTVGKGFIALAVLIVGRWNPLGALAGAMLFGFADSIQRFLAGVEGGFVVPSEFLKMLPYIVTIIAVAGLIGRVRAPAADGKPYIKS
jgi:ABC-type uncharacterized transport system permease subunit